MSRRATLSKPATLSLSERRKLGMPQARQLARKAAHDYFAAIGAEIPYDTAPGDVDLIAAVCAIQDALLKHTTATGDRLDVREDAALHAGYLLGVEIGLRLSAGAR